jgi:hypothetical protein
MTDGNRAASFIVLVLIGVAVWILGPKYLWNSEVTTAIKEAVMTSKPVTMNDIMRWRVDSLADDFVATFSRCAKVGEQVDLAENTPAVNEENNDKPGEVFNVMFVLARANDTIGIKQLNERNAICLLDKSTRVLVLNRFDWNNPPLSEVRVLSGPHTPSVFMIPTLATAHPATAATNANVQPPTTGQSASGEEQPNGDAENTSATIASSENGGGENASTGESGVAPGETAADGSVAAHQQSGNQQGEQGQNPPGVDAVHGGSPYPLMITPVRIGLAVKAPKVLFGFAKPANVFVDGKPAFDLKPLVLYTIKDGKIEEPKSNRTFELPTDKRLYLSAPSDYRVQVDGQWYRGCIELISFGNTVTVINLLDLEEYLLGVVPVEISTDSQPEALKAQATVARTLASQHIGKQSQWNDQGFDFAPDSPDQSYGGLGSETKATFKAVHATRGLVIKGVENVKPDDGFLLKYGNELAQRGWKFDQILQKCLPSDDRLRLDYVDAYKKAFKQQRSTTRSDNAAIIAKDKEENDHGE